MLVYLTPEDYFGNGSNQLCNKIPGFSFIFFNSSDCKYCSDVYPSFIKLSQSIQGCVFGIMNVDQDNRKIVRIADQLGNPIEYVPYLMLYYNGQPIAQYHHDEHRPEANTEKMKMFLIQQTKSFKADSMKKSTGSAGSSSDANLQSSIPKYSIGIPGNKKRVCYFNYSSAYPQATKN